MKKFIYIVVFIAAVGSLSFFVYLKQLSIEEKWLFFNKQVALQHAKELLADRTTSKTPDDLINMHIVKKYNMVTFDSNDQDNFYVLAYSPNGVPEPLEQSTRNKRKTTWRNLQDDWYALNIEK
jgi:hypothetical protein